MAGEGFIRFKESEIKAEQQGEIETIISRFRFGHNELNSSLH